MWFVKIIVKIILSRIPIPNRIWRRFNVFRHGKMLDIAYARSVFEYHFQNVRQIEPGSTVLELGPGDSLFTGIFSWQIGCRSILIDSDECAEITVDKYMVQLAKPRFDEHKLPAFGAENWLSEIGCTYLKNGLQSIKSLGDESVDFIFSQAVLEHIYKDELEQYAHEMYRILKRGGEASHRIDYKDHLSSSLNNLRFSDRIWESKLFRHSGFYTNRIRAQQTIKIFEQAGFYVVVLKTEKFNKIPISKKSIHVQFQNICDEDLIISGMNILCSKPE